MSLASLDSRVDFGTDFPDLRRSTYPKASTSIETSAMPKFYPCSRCVRVVLAELGPVIRMSAPDLNIVTEGSSREQVWVKFLEEITKHFDPGDSAWFVFDVGPTRPEEIAEGLNAPEDEDWSEPVNDAEE
jgi:hypothetical protein